MSQAQILNVSYSVWKTVAQANTSFIIYWHVDDGATEQGSAFIGTDEYIYTTRVVDDTWTDFNTNFPTRTAVSRRDDAIATIVGTSNVPSIKRSLDGTPLVGSQSLTLGRESFTRIDDGSTLMNIDGRATGTPDNIWNGTGAGDTGADWTVTGTGSETADSKYAGTNGWDTGVTSQNDQTVFNNGSMIDVDGTYDELEFWMQPKAYPPASKFRIRWVDDSNDAVGNQVLVSDYTANMDLDEWQKVSIPIDDFNLTGNVQKLQFRYRNTSGQDFWFDNISLTASSGGGPYKFRIEAPDSNTIYHLSMAVLQIAAPSSGWDRDAFGNISGGLTKGIIFRHRTKSTNTVLWKFITKTNMQLFGQFHPQDDVTFADGDMLIGFMVKPGKANVLITDDDILEVVIRDDLLSLAEMRAYCHYGVEVIS